MKKKILALSMATVIAMSMFTGCGSSAENKGSKDTLVLGSMGPITGEAAIYGQAVKNGAQLAVDEINANGGVNGMKLKFGKDSYVSLEGVTSYLEKISDNSKSEYHIYNSFGISRSGYFIGNQWVQVKDASKGAKYSQFCIKNCPYFNMCNEGLFSPFLSVGEILHLSGCKNKNLYYDLKGKDESEIRKDFNEILNLFEDTELRKN